MVESSTIPSSKPRRKCSDSIHTYTLFRCMFFGEFLCLIAFFIGYLIRKRNWSQRQQQAQNDAIFDIEPEDEEPPQLPKFNPLIFLPPACCDVLGTSLMYIGLNLTTASSYQMLRGQEFVFRLNCKCIFRGCYYLYWAPFRCLSAYASSRL